MTDAMPAPAARLLAALNGPDLLFLFVWNEWLRMSAPY